MTSPDSTQVWIPGWANQLHFSLHTWHHVGMCIHNFHTLMMTGSWNYHWLVHYLMFSDSRAKLLKYKMTNDKREMKRLLQFPEKRIWQRRRFRLAAVACWQCWAHVMGKWFVRSVILRQSHVRQAEGQSNLMKMDLCDCCETFYCLFIQIPLLQGMHMFVCLFACVCVSW